MFSVLKMMYEDESLDITHLMGSSSPFNTGGPLRLLYTFVPTHYFSFSHVNFSSQTLFHSGFFRVDSQPLVSMLKSLFAYETYSIFTSLSYSISAWINLWSTFISYPRSLLSIESLLSRVEYSTFFVLNPTRAPIFFEVKFNELCIFLTSYFYHTNTNYDLTLNSSVSPNTYTTENFTPSSLSDSFSHTLSESNDNQRFMRFMNPVFKYDFKVGNYMTDDMKKMNPHLFTSIKDVTTGIRKSS